MLVGCVGKMGAGKTLSASILGLYVHKFTGLPLYSNYDLQGATRIRSMADIWALDSAILLWDELWLTMDSRLWENNVALTRFINQTRKKSLLIIYTSQHINQVELRVRKATDVLIYCRRTPAGHWLQFIDYQYLQMGKRYLLPLENAKKFYGVYDTFEVLEPIQMPKKRKDYAYPDS